MNPNPISPDDPRLTAYALGEMEAAERIEFEQLLQQDAAARRTVEEIRNLAGTLGSALEGEPVPAGAIASGQLAAAIIQGRDANKLDGGPLRPRGNRMGKQLHFPQMYYYVSGLAAACFALFFIYWQDADQNREKVVLHEIDLTKMATTAQNAPAATGGGQPSPVAAKEEKVAEQAAMTVPTSVAERESTRMATMQRLELPTPAASTVAETQSVAQDRARMKESYVFRPASPGSESSVRLDKFEVSGTPATRNVTLPAQNDLTFGGQNPPAGNQPAPLAVTGFKADQAPEPAAAAVARTGTFNTEAYAYREDNPFLAVGQNPLSTFAIDVDTAAYANVRRFLAAGQRPPRDAVRIEELVNYFPYDYAGPQAGAPFAAHLEVASAPWAPEHRLVRIGLKGREVSEAARPPASLVFLLDVSGSMDEPNKLPLVKRSMRLLVDKLRADDRVAIVTYAGTSGLALPSTSLRDKGAILAAIDGLEAGGSTNGGAGLQLAYDIAKANFRPGGVNRVLLATDGDFNVGVTGEGDLVRLIEEKAKSGVFLTVLGFGMGNYKDATLEKLAERGHGNYAYIDTLAEARKALVEQAGGTLVTIAKDVKIQVEFNPAAVQAYRLIGYENRLLRPEDFNNDKIDAGEIGAGHTVTALYEVVPTGVPLPETGRVDPLKYQRPADPGRRAGNSAEMLTVKVRYKEPAGEVSNRLEFPLRDEGRQFADASTDFKFAAAVASFGMILRDSPHKGAATLTEVAAWAQDGTGRDPGGYRSEFIGLVKQAEGTHGE
ncbi:MAG: von Willebrand factor type A domain-containing protein [Opitutales bacterium]